MPRSTKSAIVLLAGVLAVLAAPVVFLAAPRDEPRDDPWSHVPARLPSTDHAALLAGPYEDGRAVTRACLECHAAAGEQMLRSPHFTWESPPVELPGRDGPTVLGKKYAVNNFCIGIASNWAACTSCHAGYGWKDGDYDFKQAENVDCLVCHDNTGTYAKTRGGEVAEGVDLVAVSRSVGGPTRDNCGSCHFRGGGGNAVKHGDLDETLYNPEESLDVHMGRHDFVCTDCHRTEGHEIRGRAISVSLDQANQARCTDCHSSELHADERIDAHVGTVACQTCHIPRFARKEATKTRWDWAEAGQDRAEDPHEYMKIKGGFVYERDVQPEYAWYDGGAEHHLLGDTFDPAETLTILRPRGARGSPGSQIWPFKVHRGTQIYDTEYRRLIQPQTAGPEGYWSTFDWDQAARLGSAAVGLPYSGSYGFAETEMYWPITHMVAPAAGALQCRDCHGEEQTRMDWRALGYDGDPLRRGGRDSRTGLRAETGK